MMQKTPNNNEKPDVRRIVKNESVMNLIRVRSICLTIIVVIGLVTSIILIVDGINSKQGSTDSKLNIIFGIFTLFLTLLMSTLFYQLISYFINKRSEDIEYMNERLEYCEKQDKKNKK